MNNDNFPKVLVVSHNPFSESQNNGKTLSSFFYGWPKDGLAQIFITGEVHDFSVCDMYFKISEIDILKSTINKKIIPGDAIIGYSVHSRDKVSDVYYLRLVRFIVANCPSLSLFTRDLIWSVSHWNNEGFNTWINEFKPDIVFFQSSSSCFMFDIVEKICKARNIPLIMHTTDDYVTSKFNLSPIFWLQHFRLKSRYKNAVKQAGTIFAIGDKMADEYNKRFGGNFKVAMNSIEIKKGKEYSYLGGKLNLIYAGNIGLNRWKVLSEIGKCLSEINKNEDIPVELSIYSSNRPNVKILREISIDGVMSYKGNLDQEELYKVRESADILVHVESFDSRNKYITRLSISTKIPEYLQTGRCVLAIGPFDVASIEYLSEHDLGFIITSIKRENLLKDLLDILTDHKKREYYALRGKEFAVRVHNPEYSRMAVRQAIIEATYNTKL